MEGRYLLFVLVFCCQSLFLAVVVSMPGLVMVQKADP
jgi:hypothetical protein